MSLRGRERRLATLESLGLRHWRSADLETCSAIAQACSDYFDGNPYGWFDALEEIFESAGVGSLHDGGACHIDLSPWATQPAWGGLARAERDALLRRGEATLAALLSSAHFEVLVLNGKGVVAGLERATGVRLPFEYAPEWDDSTGRGRRWSLELDSLERIELARPVTILGWNWNLQSSHITSRTREAIVAWAAGAIEQSVTRTPSHDDDRAADSGTRRDRELQDASWKLLELVKDATACLERAVEQLETLRATPEEIRGLSSVLEGHFNRVKFRASQLDEILQPGRSQPG